MNTIEITHILFKDRSIGIALHKIANGDNIIRITAKNKAGDLLYPLPYILNREEAGKKYKVQIINHSGLKGIFVPISELKQYENNIT